MGGRRPRIPPARESARAGPRVPPRPVPDTHTGQFGGGGAIGCPGGHAPGGCGRPTGSTLSPPAITASHANPPASHHDPAVPHWPHVPPPVTMIMGMVQARCGAAWTAAAVQAAAHSSDQPAQAIRAALILCLLVVD